MFPPRQRRKTARIGRSPLGNIVEPPAASALSRRSCSPPRDENHVSSGEEDSNHKEYHDDDGRHSSDNEKYPDDYNLSDKEDASVKSSQHPHSHFLLSDTSSNESSDTEDEPQPEPTSQERSERNSTLQSKYATMKQHTTVQLTVSEDRSYDSGFARLKLKALSNVGKEAQTKTPRLDEQVPTEPLAALEYYQRQLKELEEKNKKRLMMARQEVDSIRNRDMSATSTGPLSTESENGPELNLDLGPAISNWTSREQQHDADVNKLVDQDAALLLSPKLISRL